MCRPSARRLPSACLEVQPQRRLRRHGHHALAGQAVCAARRGVSAARARQQRRRGGSQALRTRHQSGALWAVGAGEGGTAQRLCHRAAELQGGQPAALLCHGTAQRSLTRRAGRCRGGASWAARRSGLLGERQRSETGVARRALGDTSFRRSAFAERPAALCFSRLAALRSGSVGVALFTLRARRS